MEQKQSSKDKKEKYNLDDDTSSFSPEIEEESNDEEEEELSQNNQSKEKEKEKEEINKNQNSSHLMDKLISIQKQMDTNQSKQRYSPYNYKESNNTDNKMNKNINKTNNNNSNIYNYNSRNNKNVLNLDESSQENDDYNSNNSDNSQNKKQIHEESLIPKKEKGCELFIGNLNISIEKEELNNLFSPFGEITDIRIHKNEENKKCYAFVRFASKESANSALKLDSTLLNNRYIKVTKSNENATIFIGNIRKTWTKEELETKIRRIFHNINKIEFFIDPGNPTKNRGFCFGIFNTRNEAIKALNYVNKKGGINIDGISITCDWADVVEEDDNSKSNQIFISNIKKEVSEFDLKKYFEKFGKVISVIMSKNHLNSKRKDLAFITFESHENAVSAIKKFEEEKKNEKMEKNLKKVFYLGENESVNMIQVSLAFSQEAMQNKKKIKDNRKKIPSQISKGNINDNSNYTHRGNNNINNNINNNVNNNNNNNNVNSNNKNNGKTFMGNISMNAQNEYKNYSSGHRSKNFQRHDHGRSHNYIGGNKNVQDLFSSLNNNKNIYRNNSMNNFQGNKNNTDNNLYNQLNQLFIENNMNKNQNNFTNINNNLNQNQISALTNIINLCQQNPNLLQQMTNNINNIYTGNLIGNTNEFMEINNDKKFLNRKRNSNNYLENNLNNNMNNNNNNPNEIQNNTYLNISQNQTQNQNIISQFPYIQNIQPVTQINTPNVSNIQNLQNIIPKIQNNIPNNPNFN